MDTTKIEKALSQYREQYEGTGDNAWLQAAFGYLAAIDDYHGHQIDIWALKDRVNAWQTRADDRHVIDGGDDQADDPAEVAALAQRLAANELETADWDEADAEHRREQYRQQEESSDDVQRVRY